MSKFKQLQKHLEEKGYSKDSAGSIAYSAGVKKFGKKIMSKASKEHKSASSISKKK